jgi:hypothetical protein
MMRMVIWLQTPTVFWLGGGIIFSAIECTWDNDVKQTEIHTAESLVPEPSDSKFEMAIEKLKRHKSPGSDQIPAELIEAGGRTIRSEIHKLINSIWNKEELPELSSERSQSLYLFIRRVTKQIAVIIEAYHFCQPHTKFYPTSF